MGRMSVDPRREIRSDALHGNRAQSLFIRQQTGTHRDHPLVQLARGDQNVTALEIRDVNHAYRKPALRGVSFLVGSGEFVLLLGLNGAGKTTLFSLIAGLLNLQQGLIRVLGHELPQGRSSALAGCGFVFQQSALDLDLTVAQSLRYHAALHGLSRARARERIEQELERFGLVSRMDDLVRTLSGGQRRRVEIARALLHRPRLLLLDEATVGLDVPSRRAILQRIRAQCVEEGTAALWATHLLDEVEPGDRTIVLHEGRILDDRRDISAASLTEYFDRLASSETVA
jgi:ABC-2 type transport system ATP-binding protein